MIWFAGLLLAFGVLGFLLAAPTYFSDGGSEVRQRLATNTTLGIILGGALVIAASDGRWKQSLLWAAAMLFSGGLAGFLFGVPRTKGDKSQLEQIADWMTKIIVGVGLTQLEKIPGKLGQLAEFVAVGIANQADPTKPQVAFALSLVLYFLIGGFLAGYLLMKVFIEDELARQANRGIRR